MALHGLMWPCLLEMLVCISPEIRFTLSEVGGALTPALVAVAVARPLASDHVVGALCLALSLVLRLCITVPLRILAPGM